MVEKEKEKLEKQGHIEKFKNFDWKLFRKPRGDYNKKRQIGENSPGLKKIEWNHQ